MRRFARNALLLLALVLAGPAQTACCTAGGCTSFGIGEVLGDAMIESVERSGSHAPTRDSEAER